MSSATAELIVRARWAIAGMWFTSIPFALRPPNIGCTAVVIVSVTSTTGSLGKMRTYAIRACILAATILAVSGMPVSVSAQAPAAAPPAPTSQRPLTAIQTPVPDDQLRRLTADEAVRLALENNLGLQAARFSPQL